MQYFFCALCGFASALGLAVMLSFSGNLWQRDPGPGVEMHGVRLVSKQARPGAVLVLDHGVRGSCPHDDGGFIFARARGITTPYRMTIKTLRVTARNLAPGGALSNWPIPSHWPPGRYQGLVRVWCLGARDPLDSVFAFDIRG